MLDYNKIHKDIRYIFFLNMLLFVVMRCRCLAQDLHGLAMTDECKNRGQIGSPLATVTVNTVLLDALI